MAPHARYFLRKSIINNVVVCLRSRHQLTFHLFILAICTLALCVFVNAMMEDAHFRYNAVDTHARSAITYSLATTFPRKVLADDGATLEAEGLINGVIVQSLS